MLRQWRVCVCAATAAALHNIKIQFSRASVFFLEQRQSSVFIQMMREWVRENKNNNNVQYH